MSSLEDAAHKVITKSMCVKLGEKVLIVTDKNKMTIGKALYDAAQKVTDNVKLIETPIGKISGEEPPEYVAKEMLNYDVILIPTTKSLSHTKARREAVDKGARLATLPNITKEVFMRTMEVDYNEISERTNKLKRFLNGGKKVKIMTDKGTDISMSIDGRKCSGGAGIYNIPGFWGNLPGGEACLAPLEGTTSGILIIDGSVLKQKVSEPIKVIIKDGYAIEFEGDALATKLKETLGKIGKDAFAIAELGIGTNHKAIITGNILEDEKVLGTAHIAFGNNKSYGGNIDVPVHLDAVFYKPTIYVDNKKIMENGKLLI